MRSEAVKNFFDREMSDCRLFIEKWQKLKGEADVKVKEALDKIREYEQKLSDLLVDKKKLEE